MSRSKSNSLLLKKDASIQYLASPTLNIIDEDGASETTSIRNKQSDDDVPEYKRDLSYRTADFWALPENVRSAIEISKRKQSHSEFYSALNTLYERILIFRVLFYSR